MNCPGNPNQPLTRDRLERWLNHYANRWAVLEDCKKNLVDIAVDVPLATSSIALIEGSRLMGVMIQVRTLMPWEARIVKKSWRTV